MPSHQGLTCQGWNWTLANIKAEGKETDVGAMYITDDGKTRLYIEVPTNARITVPLCFRQSVANGVEVDWGDGSAVETSAESGNTNILTSHTYSNLGKYIITLNPLNNCQLTLGSTTSSYGIMGSISEANRVYQNMLYKIEIGNNVTSLSNNMFKYCESLLNITIPDSVTSIGNSVFSNCYSLSSITIPFRIMGLGDSVFYECHSLSKVQIPKGVTTMSSSSIFGSCRVLSKITIPSSVMNIGVSLFNNCYSLSYIKLPKRVSSIMGSTTFGNCFAMKYYDFSTHTSIPTLSNTNTFNNIPSDCKIIVPDSLYETWIGTTNWSTYASKIIKKSDWEASQV